MTNMLSNTKSATVNGYINGSNGKWLSIVMSTKNKQL